MSSNTQVHVSSNERFSLARSLGPGGSPVLCSVLQKLCSGQFPPEVCKHFPWKSVVGKMDTFQRKVDSHDVVLSLQGSVPKLTISGMQTDSTISDNVMLSAHAAVNQVLGLALSDRIAQRLSTYAEGHIAAVRGQSVRQDIALKAVKLNQRVAIRATCGIVIKC